MNKTRREYDKEFKQLAVGLCNTGKTSKEVAEELGIRSELINRWKREYNKYNNGSFSGHGKANFTPEQKEILELKKALKESQLERDILKKAVSIFSKNDGKYSGL